MDEDYKGHHIQSVPRHLLPDSERWTALVVINWTSGPHEQFRRFDVQRGFATQGEAEQAGLTFAKKWIDDGKPKLRESWNRSLLAWIRRSRCRESLPLARRPADMNRNSSKAIWESWSPNKRHDREGDVLFGGVTRNQGGISPLVSV